MKANLVTQTARALYDQLMIVKEANPNDLDTEVKRMGSMAQGAGTVATLASEEVKLIINTGIIPQDSVMVPGIQNVIEKKPKSKGLLMDEFNRD